MDKRTVSSAHERIDILEKDLIAMQTAIKLQFRDLFSRVKSLLKYPIRLDNHQAKVLTDKYSWNVLKEKYLEWFV